MIWNYRKRQQQYFYGIEKYKDYKKIYGACTLSHLSASFICMHLLRAKEIIFEISAGNRVDLEVHRM